MFLAFFGDIARAGARHHRDKFPQYRILPRFIILEGIPIDNANLVFHCDSLHFEKRGLLDRILLGIAEGYEFVEILFLETDKPHRPRHGNRLDLRQFALPHADELKEIRRRKTSTFAEFTPRECAQPLTFFVVILYIEVVVLIFENRLHIHEYTFFRKASQQALLYKNLYFTLFKTFLYKISHKL